MNLGQIDQENESFLNDYKKYGYATKTQMTNDALRILRAAKMQEQRAKWREDAYHELLNSTPDYAWQSLDGEDFDKGG